MLNDTAPSNTTPNGVFRSRAVLHRESVAMCVCFVCLGRQGGEGGVEVDLRPGVKPLPAQYRCSPPRRCGQSN